MFISDLFHLNVQTHITVDAVGGEGGVCVGSLSFLVKLPKSSLDSLDDGLGVKFFRYKSYLL